MILFWKMGVDHATINENVQNPRHHYHHRLGGGRCAVLLLVQPSSINPDSGQQLCRTQQEMDVRVQRLVRECLGERVNDLLQSQLTSPLSSSAETPTARSAKRIAAERAALSVGQTGICHRPDRMVLM
jgi:hypothetical protein